MKWIIAILVVVAVLLLLGLIWTSMKRKRDQVGRERAGELRSEAAGTVLDQHEQEARARQTHAEAQRAKAEADQLEVQAAKEQTAYDQTRAQREDAVREADRLDPDVNHRSDDYAARPQRRHAHPARGTPADAAAGAAASDRGHGPGELATSATKLLLN